ncbi:MAG: hypothetical protein HUU04_09120 [Verrucomicrobiae bacterium]|nr:hypothetical protein [Verrucomicrobiae bacterium]
MRIERGASFSSRGVGRPPFFPHAARRGQALAELTIGLIAFAVLFLGLLIVGEVGRARLAAILEARERVGPVALNGFLVGSPTFYGAVGDDLQARVLSVAEDPIAYGEYRPNAWPYMQDNLVAPLQSGSLIGAFLLAEADAARSVTNYEFLVRMGVGASDLTVRQPVALPIMRSFP